MKQFTKLMAMLLFTAATQYSCINDADVAIPDKTQSDSNGNVALFLEIPNVPASRSAESSGVTEEHHTGRNKRTKDTLHRQQNHNETGNLQRIRHRQW